MLQRLIDFSLRFRGSVLAVSLTFLLYGAWKAGHAKLDVFPDFVQPQATIQTEAPGMSPEQVEMLVTTLVEGAINGVPNVESLRSQSIQGLSIVSVYFREHTDVFLARQLLSEQLSAVSAKLPAGVQTPKVTPLTSATMDLLKIGLSSDQRSPMEIRDFADYVMRPRLQAVPGVAQVGVMGGDVREYQVQVLPERLVALGVTIDEVVDAARRATGVRGAGYVETANQRIVIQTEGQVLSPEALGQVVVARGENSEVRLANVARVVECGAAKFGDVLIQGKPGVLVKLLSQYGANTMDVTREAEEALAQLAPMLAAEHIDMSPRLHRPATFIETSLRHVSRSLYVGGALVAIVLLLFLFNLRTALISIAAIPLSLLAAVAVLDWFGLTLNTITLGGLAIAIGEVVDDAIIDVENIFRRLRENAAQGHPRAPIRVVLDASLEVRGAVVYATLIVVLVFVPVLTLTGLQGRMFAPLGVAYISAILASLLVALTTTPALALVLLPRAAGRSPRDPGLIRVMKRAYAGLLGGLLRAPVLLLILGVLCSAAALTKLAYLGQEFLPEFREGHFVLQVSAVPGTSLPEMMRITGEISRDLQEHVRVDGKPAIATIEVQAGRAELGEDPWGPHRSEFHVELLPDIPGEAQAEVQSQMRDRLQDVPGITSEVLTFLGDRISETISGETAAVVVNLFGTDLDALDDKAADIAGVLGAIAGATDVHVTAPPGMPQLNVRLRPERMADLGVRPLDALGVIQTAYEGAAVAQIAVESRTYSVRIILDESRRRDVDSVAALPLAAADGTLVPLGAIADIELGTGRYMILHEGARRRQTIVCNVEGRDVGSFSAEVRKRVAALRLPAGMYVEYAGEAEAGRAARNELLLHSGIAGLGILLLLSVAFPRPRQLGLILSNLPFALVGGVLAVMLTGATLSIGSIIGFVTLFGITMRNSVMMISHFDHLQTHEQQPWGRELVLRGASERLVPVLMTALVTGLGLLPIALGSGEVGREIEGPMAIVILGGLLTSTALNLLVLPPLYLRFAAPRAGQTAAAPPEPA